MDKYVSYHHQMPVPYIYPLYNPHIHCYAILLLVHYCYSDWQLYIHLKQLCISKDIYGKHMP